jgi:hypothetical protein
VNTLAIKIECTAPVVFRHAQNVYHPASVTFSARNPDGSPYLGRWRLYRGAYVEYTSLADEAIATINCDIALDGTIPLDVSRPFGSSTFMAELYVAGSTSSSIDSGLAVKLGTYSTSTLADVDGFADAYAAAAADLAEVRSNAYADGRVTVVEATAIAYAEAQADLALEMASAYADGVVTAEEARAITDAKAQADAALIAANAAVAGLAPKYLGRRMVFPSGNNGDRATKYGNTTSACGIYLCSGGTSWTKQYPPTPGQIGEAWPDILWCEQNGFPGDVTGTPEQISQGRIQAFTGAGLVYIQMLGACLAIVYKLLANDLQIQPGGAIRAGGYQLDGSNPDGSLGFWFGALGSMKAHDATFVNCDISGRISTQQLVLSDISAGGNDISILKEIGNNSPIAWFQYVMRICASGTVRIRYSVKAQYGITTAIIYAIVVRNGSVVWTGTSHGSIGTSYTTFYEDNVPVQAGDKVGVNFTGPGYNYYTYVKDVAVSISQVPGILSYLVDTGIYALY